MPIFPVSTVPSFEEPHKNPTGLAAIFHGFWGIFVWDFLDFWDFCWVLGPKKSLRKMFNLVKL